MRRLALILVGLAALAPAACTLRVEPSPLPPHLRPEKPDDCRCDFPLVVYRNSTGHRVGCPAHDRILREQGRHPRRE